ncbi:hypothetical protein ACI65C_012538 [Semiaphis heraclei]
MNGKGIFEGKVVQSSNIEDYNSSEVEEDNLKLDADEVKQYLKSIPSFNKNSIFDDVESSDHATSSSSSTTSSPSSKLKTLPSVKTKMMKLPNKKIQSPTNLKIDALQGS